MVLLIGLNSKLHCSSRVLSAGHADREQVLDALLEIQRSLLCAPDANGDCAFSAARCCRPLVLFFLRVDGCDNLMQHDAVVGALVRCKGVGGKVGLAPQRR